MGDESRTSTQGGRLAIRCPFDRWRAGLVRATVAGALVLLAIGCAFDPEGIESPSAEVSVRLLEAVAADVDCEERSKQIAWIFHRCAFCEFGVNRYPVLAEEGVRDPSGGSCVYSARPTISHYDYADQVWTVIATDEVGWATQCEPQFLQELRNTQGFLQGVNVTQDIAFEHCTDGCATVETIDG